MFERPGLVVHLDSIRLSEYDDDGFLGFQIDADGQSASPELEAGVEPYEALHAYGFLSRPLDPTVDGAGELIDGARSLTLWEGARVYSVALHDSRVVPALARCKPGESVQYGSANNFVRCHDDGRVSAMCTDDGTEAGETIAAEVGPAGFSWWGPWGAMRHNGQGYYYRHASGARFELGGIAGLPSPLDQVSSSARLTAHLVTINGTICKFGVGTFMPAAKATPVIAADAALLSAIQAQQAALAALGAILANAAAGTAIAAALAAVEAAAGTVSAAATALPAASVLVA